jgi:hypothetical protein
MPSSYVCIIHTGNGLYTEALVGNALQCLHALQRSVRASAPDFIPSIAVFFADPQKGARCVYSSVVPDRNHALDRVAATYPPLANTNGGLFVVDDDAPEKQAERTTAFAQLFRLRSPLLLQQSVLLAARRQNDTAAISAGVEHDDSSADATSSPSSSSDTSMKDGDVWGSLAGALLASLCYLRAHPSSPFAGSQGDDAEADANDATDDACYDSMNPSRSTSKILVFSDARAGAAPSYSAECALAVTAVTASKMGVVVSCFGDTVAQTDVNENRLIGLASSLGGFCAPRFTLADLGQLLDGERGLTDGGSGSRSRRKRTRITSQFVIGPTMLPRTPLSPASLVQSLSDVPTKKTRKEGGTGDGASTGECTSHLGWLCPACMAIIYRNPREPLDSSGTADQRGDDGSMGPVGELKCPYCYAA